LLDPAGLVGKSIDTRFKMRDISCIRWLVQVSARRAEMFRNEI